MQLSVAGRLKADIRLAQAVSQFEADLTSEQKVEFRTQRSVTHSRAPQLSDVMHLTASIDRSASSSSSQLGFRARCVGPRLTNFLQSVQQYVALGDVVVGGAQNLVASGVWALVRFSFLSLASHAAYLEKLSMLFMHAGRSAPRYQQMALLYPRSRTLQTHLNEYFITVVHICHHVLRFSRKSMLGQFTAAIGDADLKQFQTDLDTWASTIREDVNLLMNQTIEDEAAENSGFRAIMSSFSASAAHRMATKDRLAVLDVCSRFDHQTPWKQTRKIGNSSLFASSDEYNNFKSDPGASSRTLIWTGILGSGKSVLMANIVDDLNIHAQSHKMPVTYFFCRHDIPESLRPRTIIGSLVRQLLSTMSTLLPPPNSWEASPQVEGDDLLAYLFSLPSSWSGAYFVLDGLDECKENDRRALLRHIGTLQKKLNIMICFSLRLEADNSFHHGISRLVAPVHVTIPGNNPDIAGFITSELDARINTGFVVGDPEIYHEIRDALLQGAQGMFLWVSLQITSLCAERTDEKIRTALRNLPTTLSETFTRILMAAASHGNEYQRPILELLAVALRPLTADELREALSVTPGDTSWDRAKLINNVHSVLACCGSLVMTDEEEGTIRLIHHSVKQYLFGQLGDDVGYTVEDADRRMGSIILTYLNYDIFDSVVSKMTLPSVSSQTAPKQVLETIDAGTRRAIALRLLKSRARNKLRQNSGSAASYNLSQALVNLGNYYRAASAHDAFLGYARAFWLAHTGSIKEDDVFLHDALVELIRQDHLVDVAASRLNEHIEWAVFDIPPSLDTLAATTSFSRVSLSLRISHLPLLRYELKTGQAIKTISNIVIVMRILASSADPPRWNKTMCCELLRFSFVSRSLPAIRLLSSGGGASAPTPMSELFIEAVVRQDKELLDEAVFTNFTIRQTRGSGLAPAYVAGSRTLAAHPRLPIEASFVSYLASLVPTGEYASSLLCFLDGVDTRGLSEYGEVALAQIRADVPLTFSFDVRHAQRLLANCLPTAKGPGNDELPQAVMALFSKQQRNEILYDCCALVQPWQHKMIALAVDLGADWGSVNVDSGLPCISRLIRSSNFDMAALDALLGGAARPSATMLPIYECQWSDMNYCLDQGMPHVLRRLLDNGYHRLYLQLACHDRGLLHRCARELKCERVKMLCDVVKVDVNRRGPGIDGLPSYTALLSALDQAPPEADPSDVVMQLAIRGSDLSDCSKRGQPFTAVAAVLHQAGKPDFQYKKRFALVRLARTLVTFGAKFEFHEVHWMVTHLLARLWAAKTALSPLPRPPPPATAAIATDECTVCLASLLGDMLRRRPPLPAEIKLCVDEIVRTMGHRAMTKVPGDNNENKDMAKLFLDMLTMLRSAASHSLRANLSSPNRSIVRQLRKQTSSIISMYLREGERQGRQKYFHFPMYTILQHGSLFHDDVAEEFTNMFDEWARLVRPGIQAAVAEGDVDSVRAGCALLKRRPGTRLFDDNIRAAELVRERLNQCAQPGQCYELEADVPETFLSSR